MVVPDLTPRIVVAETEKSSVPSEGGIVTFGYELRNLSGKEVSLVVSDPNMLAAQAEGDAAEESDASEEISQEAEGTLKDYTEPVDTEETDVIFENGANAPESTEET